MDMASAAAAAVASTMPSTKAPAVIFTGSAYSYGHDLLSALHLKSSETMFHTGFSDKPSAGVAARAMIWLAILGAAVASMWGRMAAAENVS